jgi:hypothetical protein
MHNYPADRTCCDDYMLTITKASQSNEWLMVCMLEQSELRVPTRTPSLAQSALNIVAICGSTTSSPFKSSTNDFSASSPVSSATAARRHSTRVYGKIRSHSDTTAGTDCGHLGDGQLCDCIGQHYLL